jgi:glycosyltransferase involved in cell wall biosynthesis
MGVLKNKWVIRLLELLEHRAYRDAHGLVALAPGIGAAIERHGIPSSRIALIPNACDLDLFHPVPAKQKDRIPGHRGSPFVAAFCGAHGKANGLEAVLDAARCLIDQGEREIELLFIGTGSEKEALIRRARDEGLDNCRFLDLQPKTQLAGWLPHVDVGLMILANVPAFYYGTSPNKFFDYIAAGLPVVVNYPGWLATLIVQHECGMVVPPGDPRAFAQALRELKENPTRVREMGIHSRTLAEQEFSRESLASRFVAFLEQTTTAVKGGKQKL